MAMRRRVESRPCDPLTPLPYSPAGAAEKLYVSTAPGANSCLSSCLAAPGVLYGGSVISPGAFGPVQETRSRNYGGLNDMNLGPYYDPRSLTTRAPMDGVGSAIGGAGLGFGEDGAGAGAGLRSLPVMGHGPAAFFGDVGDAPPRPRTQFAPHGTLQVEPIRLDVWEGPCVCSACGITPYSLASMLVLPSNALAVRCGLEAAGLVKVSRRLRAQTPVCACAVMGGPDHFAGLLAFAEGYGDVSAAQVLDPGATLAQLDELYESRVAGAARNMVIGASMANYARAEGNMAYLAPRPVAEATLGDAVPCLPEFLPGTGCRTTPEDTPYAALALTNPAASVAHRAALGCQMGLRIGGGSVPIHSMQPRCPGAPVVADAELHHRPTFTPAPVRAFVL
jgi:hypothetical protein